MSSNGSFNMWLSRGFRLGAGGGTEAPLQPLLDLEVSCSSGFLQPAGQQQRIPSPSRNWTTWGHLRSSGKPPSCISERDPCLNVFQVQRSPKNNESILACVNPGLKDCAEAKPSEESLQGQMSPDWSFAQIPPPSAFKDPLLPFRSGTPFCGEEPWLSQGKPGGPCGRQLFWRRLGGEHPGRAGRGGRVPLHNV